MLTWEETALENRMYQALETDFGTAKAAHLSRLYASARSRLVGDVLTRIPAAEPEMTDHTAKHVATVMANADSLIGPTALEPPNPTLSGADAYILCLAILFHDAGMAFGRSGHQQQIPQIHSWVQEGSEDRPAQEKTLLHVIVSSHTGVTEAGSRDTLKSVDPTMDLEGKRVQAQEVAAILRFADELSEDPWRTSSFVTDVLGIGEKSQVYHDYATITSVYANRPDGRISLKYELPISLGNGTNTEKGRFALESERLRKLLAFTFQRIVKLDRERRYARSYSRHIEPFNRTDVTLNFWTTTTLLDVLGPLELSDRSILDRPPTNLDEIDAEYDTAAVIRRIQERVAKE